MKFHLSAIIKLMTKEEAIKKITSLARFENITRQQKLLFKSYLDRLNILK